MSDDPLESASVEVVASAIADRHLPGSVELVADIGAALDRAYADGWSDGRHRDARAQLVRWLGNNTASPRHDQWTAYELEEAADEMLALLGDPS